MSRPIFGRRVALTLERRARQAHSPSYDSHLEHNCVSDDCPVCEWIEEQRDCPSPQERSCEKPVRSIHVAWALPLRGLTAMSLLGYNVVRYS